jgi:KaiC/GvpD/RAD55 family RecA-like ATPase
MTTAATGKLIIKGLLTFHDYAMKYIDKLKTEYFSVDEQTIFKCIFAYYKGYSKIPSQQQILQVLLPKYLINSPEKIPDVEDNLQSICAMETNTDDFYQWLEDETKIFIKDARMVNALMKSMDFLAKHDTDGALKLINEAASVNFDDNLGLDYFADVESRLLRMKEGVNVIPSGYQQLDNLIGGGWRNKSLVVFGAATNVGKTLIMSDISFKLIKKGKNGLYITLEINQDWLANRIDANLTNIELNDLDDHIDAVQKCVKEAESKMGKFIVKEYPPDMLNSNQILAFVRELQIKKGFKPDFICLDYLGLMAPNGKSFSDNTYGKLKTVSKELRTIACLLDIPIFTAVQTNRDGYGSSEVGMEKTADSMGIPMTADIMIMVSRNKDMESESKMWWNIAKSRYSKNGTGLFMNVEYGNMRFTPSEANSQEYQEKNKPDNKTKIANIKNKKIEVSKSVHTSNESQNSTIEGTNVKESEKAINI